MHSLPEIWCFPGVYPCQAVLGGALIPPQSSFSQGCTISLIRISHSHIKSVVWWVSDEGLTGRHRKTWNFFTTRFSRERKWNLGFLGLTQFVWGFMRLLGLEGAVSGSFQWKWFSNQWTPVSKSISLLTRMRRSQVAVVLSIISSVSILPLGNKEGVKQGVVGGNKWEDPDS